MLDQLRSTKGAKLARRNTVRIAADFHRTGVRTPEAALSPAQHVMWQRGLRLDGLFIYPRYVSAPVNRQANLLAAIGGMVTKTLNLWTSSGLKAEIVSGGSTPTDYQSHLIRGLTQIRPGTYIFNDMNTLAGGFCTLPQSAAGLMCTAISDAVPDKVMQV